MKILITKVVKEVIKSTESDKNLAEFEHDLLKALQLRQKALDPSIFKKTRQSKQK